MQAAGKMHLYIIAAILHCAASVCSAAGGGRVLHFPADRTVGQVFVMDSRGGSGYRQADKG